jgi:hypothetical protein
MAPDAPALRLNQALASYLRRGPVFPTMPPDNAGSGPRFTPIRIDAGHQINLPVVQAALICGFVAFPARFSLCNAQ